MEEFVTYILYSPQYEKIYIGYSTSLIQRFYSHNFLATKGHTLRYRPWVVLEAEFNINICVPTVSGCFAGRFICIRLRRIVTRAIPLLKTA